MCTTEYGFIEISSPLEQIKGEKLRTSTGHSGPEQPGSHFLSGSHITVYILPFSSGPSVKMPDSEQSHRE